MHCVSCTSMGCATAHCMTSCTKLHKTHVCMQCLSGILQRHNRQKIFAFIHRCVRTGFCSPDLADFRDPYISSDEKLFNKILTCPNHILRTLLPPPTAQNYSLRNRPHNRQLPDRTYWITDCNFTARMLYRNTYKIAPRFVLPVYNCGLTVRYERIWARLKETGTHWNQPCLILQCVPIFFKGRLFTSVFVFVPSWYALICIVKFNIFEKKIISKKWWEWSLGMGQNTCISTKSKTFYPHEKCGTYVNKTIFARKWRHSLHNNQYGPL